MSHVPPPATQPRRRPPKPQRLWMWFLGGFLAVFFLLGLFYPMYFYDGRSAHPTMLWRYYLLELQLELNSSGNLGPTSGNWEAALITAVTHVIISAIGGVAVCTIAWALQRRSKTA